MAVLSPALVVAMSVMFVLTRLHQHFNIFEVLLFYGLKYCIQPDRQLLEKLSAGSNSSKGSSTPAASSSSAKPTVVKRETLEAVAAAGGSSKNKLTVSALPVRRAKITALFFSSDVDFPYHASIHHVLSLCCGYFAALAFESFLSCRYPHFLVNTRSFYVALFTIAYIVVQAWRISMFLSSLRIMMLLTAFSALVAVVVLSLGDHTALFRANVAFDSFYHAAFIMLRARLHLDAVRAALYAARLVSLLRLAFPLIVAVAISAVVVPARRFSMLDFQLRADYVADSRDVAEDPYALPPPKMWTMLWLVADYAVGALFAFIVVASGGRDAHGSAWRLRPLWRVGALAVVVGMRASLVRLRLQAYLDGAIDSYRRFWRLRVSMPTQDAVALVTRTVVSTTFYLPMIACAYLVSILPPVLFLLVAVFNGDGDMTRVLRPAGLCRSLPVGVLHPGNVFMGEVALFFAWCFVAAFVAFAGLSFLAEVVFAAVGMSERGRPVKVPVANSASERRRLKRLKQQQSVTVRKR